MPVPLPSDEPERLAALYQSHILDTLPEQEFDDLVHLAAHICGTPLAAVSLIDADRQWFKSVLGFDVAKTPRDMAFCAHSILQDDILIVPDSHADPRFAGNSLVCGDPHIRFYAGAPLVADGGHALGSLCVFDRVPRQLTPQQQTALRMLARQVAGQIELQRRVRLQEQMLTERAAAEAKRAAAEAERQALAVLVEASADSIVSTDLAGKILSWNGGAERLYGFTAQEIVGQSQDVLVPQGETSVYSRFLPTLLRHGRLENLEVVHQRKNGECLDVSQTLSLIRDATGEPLAISVVGRDITGKKQAEQALEAQRQFQSALLESLQEGIVACDASGTLTLFNRATREFHGLPQQPLPPEQWADHFSLYGTDGVTLLQTAEIPLFRALQGETVRGTEMVIAPNHGSVRTLLASGQAIYDAQGQKLGAVVAMHDITARKQAEQDLQRSEARLREAQQLAHIGSWEFDPRTGHILWSEELFHLFGLDPQNGAPSVEELMTYYHPDDVATHREITSRAISDGLPYEFDIRILHQDGTVRWAHAMGRGERDSFGTVARLAGTLLDIHERKSMEEALRESSQFIEGITQASTSIIFVLDLDTMANVYSNRSVADFLGYSREEVKALGSDLLPALLHPDDLQSVQSHFDGFAETPDGEAVEIEYRARHASGEWRWIWNRETVFKRHPDGTPWQILGTAYDVTERRQAQEEAARLAAIVESSQDAILGATLDGTLVSWNTAAEHLYGYAESEVIGQHASCLDPPEERSFIGEIIRAIVRGERRENVEVKRQRKNGEWIDISLTFSPIRNGAGAITGIAAMGRDITEKKRAEKTLQELAVLLEVQKQELEKQKQELEKQKQELEKMNGELAALATMDGLTGLENRRAFDARLQEAFAHASRCHEPLSLLLLDLDHFKGYNDAFGHLAGDEVLRQIGRVLKQATRATDIVARYGGEEIAVILPETDSDVALQIAERVRQAVAAAPWEYRTVTASLGVSTLGLGMKHAEDMVAGADRALYHSKLRGRNCFTHALLVSLDHADARGIKDPSLPPFTPAEAAL